MAFHPTSEQDLSASYAKTGKNLKIKAFAGAAKTTTCIYISTVLNGLGKVGLYLSFNKAIILDAKSKFGRNVVVKTAHALAYHAIVLSEPRFKEKLNGRLNGNIVVNKLRIKANTFDELSSFQAGNLILGFVKNFQQSADDVLSMEHLPKEYLTEIEVKKSIKVSLKTKIELFKRAESFWRLMIDPASHVYIEHDTYLKLFALSKPTLSKYDYVMLDEAQDSNPVLIDMIINSSPQKIIVGDRFQQIYSWRGSVNMMDLIDIEQTCYLSQSFRFGPAIADLANDILLNELGNTSESIKGFDKLKSIVLQDFSGVPNCIIYRTNAGLVSGLVDCIRNGVSFSLVADVRELNSLIIAIEELERFGSTDNSSLRDFDNFQNFVQFCESPLGSDLKALLKVTGIYGYAYLKAALNKSVDEGESQVVLTTAHKSKGREWPVCKIADDWSQLESHVISVQKGEISRVNSEEFNLIYVAATRAKNILVIGDNAYLNWVYSGRPVPRNLVPGGALCKK